MNQLVLPTRYCFTLILSTRCFIFILTHRLYLPYLEHFALSSWTTPCEGYMDSVNPLVAFASNWF
jgi:hypothetical protein